MITKTHNNDKVLARPQTLSEEHFEANPDEIHWGHVGDLAGMLKNLRKIRGHTFQEGECAE